MRIGVIYWHPGDEISDLLSDTLRELGQQALPFLHHAMLPVGLHAVLLWGPYNSIVPLGQQLVSQPVSDRPALIFWITEQMWNPVLPMSLARMVGDWRFRLEWSAFQSTGNGQWRIDPRRRWLMGGAYRFRYYGDLHWLEQKGLLSRLAVGSPWRAHFLEKLGFKPVVAYLGSHPRMGMNLQCERDISVVWFGKSGSRRRARLLSRIRQDLARRQIPLLVIDGKENPFIFGEQRAHLLNRAKIVLNLVREPWDENALRYFVTAPNRALIVTEPTLPHTPFTNGVHLVEARSEVMAETICYYLAHEHERKRITDAAYDLVTHHLTTRQGVERILDRLAPGSDRHLW